MCRSPNPLCLFALHSYTCTSLLGGLRKWIYGCNSTSKKPSAVDNQKTLRQKHPPHSFAPPRPDSDCLPLCPFEFCENKKCRLNHLNSMMGVFCNPARACAVFPHPTRNLNIPQLHCFLCRGQKIDLWHCSLFFLILFCFFCFFSFGFFLDLTFSYFLLSPAPLFPLFLSPCLSGDLI